MSSRWCGWSGTWVCLQGQRGELQRVRLFNATSGERRFPKNSAGVRPGLLKIQAYKGITWTLNQDCKNVWGETETFMLNLEIFVHNVPQWNTTRVWLLQQPKADLHLIWTAGRLGNKVGSNFQSGSRTIIFLISEVLKPIWNMQWLHQHFICPLNWWFHTEFPPISIIDPNVLISSFQTTLTMWTYIFFDLFRMSVQ